MTEMLERTMLERTTLGRTTLERTTLERPGTRRPVLARTRAELAAARAVLPGPVGVVPTMGALHEGHAKLLRIARADNPSVIATVFVNPLQFGPTEDLDRYPRTLEADLEVCAAEGVDVVFAPHAAEMYPTGQPLVRVDAGPLGEQLEGESRPGHFAGMLTVVNKLLNLTRADRAYFGEKDFQQLVLIRQMVDDLDLPVEILGVPIVRNDDGLALSSRNRYLDPDQRAAALAVPSALAAGREAAERGTGADDIRGAVLDVLAAQPSLRLDRLDLVDAVTLGPAVPARPARLLVAVFAGSTRLIDNVAIRLTED
jgi:pantoate--beta-alanine ligase